MLGYTGYTSFTFKPEWNYGNKLLLRIQQLHFEGVCEHGHRCGICI